ncbi:DNA-binding MarR family transcriptional regulator [Sinobacterium caligoides]|uniref:DNA-binding MarR family transcriptional regulator n=1 Tax=Sinobacterium caligoides TaxID=933926 RepID=A0A3N2DZ63_9GAMM|nr:MarR family transcriptional regulator [Sinobacterium caligoides]ROS05110.1 DNA-binding MarR family transcriptional regulator [Sinobacterium caligoides]
MPNLLVDVPELNLSASFMMGLAHKRFRVTANQALCDEVDITLEMFGALATLDHHPGITQQQLSDILQRERSATKRLVDNCIKRELITACKGESENKKARYLSLTPLGSSTKERSSQLMAEVRKQFFSALSPEEEATLYRLCRQLVTEQ